MAAAVLCFANDGGIRLQFQLGTQALPDDTVILRKEKVDSRHKMVGGIAGPE